ncbi:MAG: hypothetical protein JRN08_05540 [Nitrososphaerota archaeon]|nr:hypothetical protein [Nitrososphaerota archaeon]MDG6983154.1 hypothetical protein [Nitrososphaerota archaeon]
MSEIRAKTRHGEMTIDQLAEIQPGMAALMKEAGDRFTHTYYAAKGGNWKLAAHNLNQLRASFRTAKVTRPKFAEDLDAYDKEYLLPIFESIRDQDWNRFEAAFRKGEDGSDIYHDKRGYPHIRYLLPKDPPSNLYLGPPEEFKRGSRAAGKTP